MTDVFILGAGFSKAIYYEMPTLAELSKKVRDGLLHRKFRLPVEIDNMGDNIEAWMSYLSQRQPWLKEYENDKNRSLAGEMREEIGRIIDTHTSNTCLFFSKHSWPQWLSSLILSWHKNQATVITLNYDTLIENALVTLVNNSKFLDDQHNISDITIGDIYPRYLSDILSRSMAVVAPDGVVNTFSYLKLHGSLNWYYSGRTDFYGETIYYSNVLQYGPPPVLHRDKEMLLIPPVYEKTGYFNNESVRRLWRDAGTALAEAERVFVIGYSLPSSDLGMGLFLLHNQPVLAADTYIVNIDSELKSRFDELLPKQPINSRFIGEHDAVVNFAEQYIQDDI